LGIEIDPTTGHLIGGGEHMDEVVNTMKGLEALFEYVEYQTGVHFDIEWELFIYSAHLQIWYEYRYGGILVPVITTSYEMTGILQ
jgi:hypothetical protein